MSDFNSPEFLKVAIKHGLLSPSADAMVAYELYGRLLRDEKIQQRQIAMRAPQVIAGMTVTVPPKIEVVIEAMPPDELQALRERVTGVLPFRK